MSQSICLKWEKEEPTQAFRFYMFICMVLTITSINTLHNNNIPNLGQFISELHREKTCLGSLTRSDTNQPIQLQKIARGLKLGIKKIGFFYVAKTNSCMVTAQLSAFVFVYIQKNRFSEAAQANFENTLQPLYNMDHYIMVLDITWIS